MKIVKIKDEIHTNLLLLKVKLGLKSLSDTIKYLLDDHKN